MNSKNFTVRLPEDFIDQLAEFAEDHDISKATAIKVGLLRLFKRKPTAQELAEAEAPLGNPQWTEGSEGASRAGKSGGRGRKRN